jgi:hypothetical protein
LTLGKVLIDVESAWWRMVFRISVWGRVVCELGGRSLYHWWTIWTACEGHVVWNPRRLGVVLSVCGSRLGGDVWGSSLGVISRPLHSKTSLKNMFLDWNMRFRVAALSTFGGHHSKTSLENISQKHLSKTSLKKTSLKNISQKHLSKTSLKNISQKHLSKTSLSNISQKHLSTTSLHPEKTPSPHSFSDPRDPMGHMFPYGHIHPRGHMRQKAYVPIRQPSDIYSERKTIFPHPFKN